MDAKYCGAVPTIDAAVAPDVARIDEELQYTETQSLREDVVVAVVSIVEVALPLNRARLLVTVNNLHMMLDL